MDIKSITPTSRVTFELDGKDASVTFDVAFVAPDQLGDYVTANAADNRLSALVRKVLIDAVGGWDLTEDGVPIPCTAETKAKYLPIIFGLVIKTEAENPFDKVLGRALLNYAMEPGNFLKN